METYTYNDIQNSIDNNRLSFFVQPQCRSADGKIVGGEALARIYLPNGEIVSPGPHIEMMEQDDYITKLDKIIWKNVCEWIEHNKAKNLQVLPLSINLSRHDFDTFDVRDYLNTLVSQKHISRKFLRLEVTETACAKNFDYMKRQLEELKNDGFSICLDDFGKGLSSLSVLDQIPIDSIKLDMSFMKKSTCMDDKNISILKAIVNIAQAINASVIAEGIETKEQVKVLHDIGIKHMQGFFFSKPVTKEVYQKMINLEFEK